MTPDVRKPKSQLAKFKASIAKAIPGVVLLQIKNVPSVVVKSVFQTAASAPATPNVSFIFGSEHGSTPAH